MIAWAAALSVPIALVTWLALALGQVSLVHDQAQSVADLAAIAVVEGNGSCAAAARVVEANAETVEPPGLALSSCDIDVQGAKVVVQGDLPALARRALAWLGVFDVSVSARARAEPG